MKTKVIQPSGWLRPKGYANGMVADGALLVTGGLIGWDERHQFPSDDFIDQLRQTLNNTVQVLAGGGARPEHIVRMTWYITDKGEYLGRQREIGIVYRETIGRHFPAMAVVEVAALLEDRAKVEIETTAVIPYERG